MRKKNMVTIVAFNLTGVSTATALRDNKHAWIITLEKPTKRTSVFDKGEVIGLHRAGKSAKEVSQMMAIGLRTVQTTIYQWWKDGEVRSFSGNRGRATILNTRHRRSRKRLVKANRRKSDQQLTSMFNEGSKKILLAPCVENRRKWVEGAYSPPGSQGATNFLAG